MTKISAVDLSAVLHGDKIVPTAEQAGVTQAPPGPMLVVAGAGAGKTETMSSRVLWLVANGYATPDQVLGLTFTRKAAQELSQRIRKQFAVLAGSPVVRDLDPSGSLSALLVDQAPTVLTYDAYAGRIIREYGLLVPVEPDARLITNAELWAIAHKLVSNYRGDLSTSNQVSTTTQNVLDLVTEMDNNLVEPQGVIEASEMLRDLLLELPKGPRQQDKPSQSVMAMVTMQQLRIELMPLVQALKEELAAQRLVTFNEQMAVAARLVRDNPMVAASQRSRHRVVMLDEYQDTSHSQRVLLSHLYGTPHFLDEESEGNPDPSLTVTAVGDPMQAIYGWRGATVENLNQFVRDFPTHQGEAEKRQLTTSWRNPPRTLALANSVADSVFAQSGGPRPVDPLQARSTDMEEDVVLGLFSSADEERAFVADRMAAEFDAAQEEDRRFKAAVLVRANKHAAAMGLELEKRGIPYEIVGLDGLLHIPEVADLVAIATLLVRPQDNQAALRVLFGPMVGLGLADVMALHQRVRNLAGRDEPRPQPEDGVENLKAQIEEICADQPDQIMGLADAIADLGERERFSPEAIERLEALSAKLRHLRTYSLGKPLVDLFADIDKVCAIRTEVLTHRGARGAVHLDKFFSAVADYPGENLAGLLDYLHLARQEEKGLQAGEVIIRSDRVQILTAHKAKGLEWDVVSVLHADAKTYKARTSVFSKNATELPELSEKGVDLSNYMIDGQINSSLTRKDLEEDLEEYRKKKVEQNADESSRLFYVAMTRTERVLLITASDEPYEHFEELAQANEDLVVQWAEEFEEAEAQEANSTLFGGVTPQQDALAGADLVNAARKNLPDAVAGETFEFWEREVSALIAEHEALSQPQVDVEMPREMTASDLVNLKADPVQFARRQRRPVPFKPNTYAKRGTAFHQWLEDRLGQRSLLDEEQLPGMDQFQEELEEKDLKELKEAFLNSEWAQRSPTHVEQPFELNIGGAIVRGRMDAIFRNPDGSWLVVDWKTGRKPSESMASAQIQLAVYREAWRRIVGPEDEVDAAFVYIRTNETYSPQNLPEGEELAALYTEHQRS